MRLILFTLALCCLILMSWLLFGANFEAWTHAEKIKQNFEEFKNIAWLFGILCLVLDLFLPIPSTIVMSGLGAMYGPLWGGIIATVGSFCAGILGYGMGQLLGEDRTQKIFGTKDFQKGQNLFLRHGAWLVAMSRSLPIFPEVLSCMAGLLRMPLKTFCFALFFGTLPMSFLFAALGNWGLTEPQWALLFSLFIPALLWFLSRFFLKK